MSEHPKPTQSNQSEQHEHEKPAISRRAFFRRAGVLSAAGVATAAAGCEVAAPTAFQVAPLAQNVIPQSLPQALQYPEIPLAPLTAPEPGILRFFTMHEARTVEALTARLLPGTPDDPGAREAGVVNYIDHFLSYPEGFGEAIYRRPPFAQVYQGDTPPPEAENGSYQAIWVAADQITRYGYQSQLTPREVYRVGVANVDRFARLRFGADFISLDEAQQDEIVGAMAEGNAEGFEQMAGEQFFHVLRRHTMEGMFSDPAYGGNRGMVGWRLIGYPGAQRAYTPDDIRTQGTPLEPQSLHDLHEFNEGQHARDGVVLPLSGSDPNTWYDAHQQAPVPANDQFICEIAPTE